jgi:zona occludens toxin
LQVDSRQNVLKNPKLWILAIGTVLMFCLSIYALRGFFNGPRLQNQSNEKNRTNSAPKLEEKLAKHDMPAFSEKWRVVGSIRSGMDTLIVLSNPSGRIRLESPSMFHNSGALLIGEIDGQRVTTWSGQSSSSRSPGGSI